MAVGWSRIRIRSRVGSCWHGSQHRLSWRWLHLIEGHWSSAVLKQTNMGELCGCPGKQPLGDRRLAVETTGLEAVGAETLRLHSGKLDGPN